MTYQLSWKEIISRNKILSNFTNKSIVDIPELNQYSFTTPKKGDIFIHLVFDITRQYVASDTRYTVKSVVKIFKNSNRFSLTSDDLTFDTLNPHSFIQCWEYPKNWIKITNGYEMKWTL